MASVVIGTDTETRQEVRIGDIERRSGLYVLGKPGMGKSAMLIQLMLGDSEHGHGLFFLDPHGDAIRDLLRRIEKKRLEKSLLFDPEDETHSFGINLLACRNVASLKERTDTYTRAYRVFEKLWEEDFGPWLQLILEYTLYVFIENQEYTLAEVPLFLRDADFRNHLVRNVKYNPDAADFWRYDFGEKRERDQQVQIQAALTRVRTLLGHPYVRHIIGQHKTTIDFPRMLEQPTILLMRLSANLAPDIKKFIGTILIGELLHAVRNRPEDKRGQYSIVVDEFQNFSATDDFTTFITEARKFGIAATVSHQERFGQFAGNPKLMGATAAAANKIFFQLTVKDAEELAPEFAELVQPTEKRREAELVLSSHPVEDIWEKGHTHNDILYIRGKFFWIVDLLRRNANEKYFVFDPSRVPPSHTKDNPIKLQWDDFTDWELYRSTPEMLKQGIDLLNLYYRNCMDTRFNKRQSFDETLELVLKIIECFGGVFGFRPTMMPYIPEEMRLLYVRRMEELRGRNVEKAYGNIEDALRYNGLQPGTSAYYSEHARLSLALKRDPIYTKRTELSDIPGDLIVKIVPQLRQAALTIGFSPHELEQFIQWKAKPINAVEAHWLREYVRYGLKEEYPATKEDDERDKQIFDKYFYVMAHPMLRHMLGNKWPSTTVAATRPHKERRDSPEFPFLRLALAICDENDRNGGGDTLEDGAKVPVPADMGNWAVRRQMAGMMQEVLYCQ